MVVLEEEAADDGAGVGVSWNLTSAVSGRVNLTTPFSGPSCERVRLGQVNFIVVNFLLLYTTDDKTENGLVN